MKTTIVLTLLAGLAALLPGHALELQRGAAEPWRLVTCHFTHWNYEQLAWDGLAFLGLGIASAWRNRIGFRATLLASVFIVPVAVLAFAPHLDAYRGLSGIASALFALILTLEGGKNRLVALCAVAFAAKLGFEVCTGATVFVRDMGPGVVAVPVAHLAGAAVGSVVGLFCVVTTRCRSGAGRKPAGSFSRLLEV